MNEFLLFSDLLRELRGEIVLRLTPLSAALLTLTCFSYLALFSSYRLSNRKITIEAVLEGDNEVLAYALERCLLPPLPEELLRLASGRGHLHYLSFFVNASKPPHRFPFLPLEAVLQDHYPLLPAAHAAGRGGFFEINKFFNSKLNMYDPRNTPYFVLGLIEGGLHKEFASSSLRSYLLDIPEDELWAAVYRSESLPMFNLICEWNNIALYNERTFFEEAFTGGTKTFFLTRHLIQHEQFPLPTEASSRFSIYSSGDLSVVKFFTERFAFSLLNSSTYQAALSANPFNPSVISYLRQQGVPDFEANLLPSLFTTSSPVAAIEFALIELQPSTSIQLLLASALLEARNVIGACFVLQRILRFLQVGESASSLLEAEIASIPDLLNLLYSTAALQSEVSVMLTALVLGAERELSDMQLALTLTSPAVIARNFSSLSFLHSLDLPFLSSIFSLWWTFANSGEVDFGTFRAAYWLLDHGCFPDPAFLIRLITEETAHGLRVFEFLLRHSPTTTFSDPDIAACLQRFQPLNPSNLRFQRVFNKFEDLKRLHRF